MVEFEIDGVAILVGVLVLILTLTFVAFTVQGVGDWIDGIINDPNRPVDSYEVVCEFTLENAPLVGLRFDETRGVQCYSRKPKLFSLESSKTLSIFGGDGLVRMTIDGKERYKQVSVGIFDDKKTTEMIIKEVSSGTHTLVLQLLDESYKPLDPILGMAKYQTELFVGG